MLGHLASGLHYAGTWDSCVAIEIPGLWLPLVPQGCLRVPTLYLGAVTSNKNSMALGTHVDSLGLTNQNCRAAHTSFVYDYDKGYTFNLDMPLGSSSGCGWLDAAALGSPTMATLFCMFDYFSCSYVTVQLFRSCYSSRAASGLHLYSCTFAVLHS